MSEDEDKVNVLALHCVGGRLSHQPSNALPSHYYGDPSKVVQFTFVDRIADPVQALLEDWAKWMRRYESGVEGYPSEASGGFITSWQKDFEEMVAAADLERMQKIDAAFRSLLPRYRDAIMLTYGLQRKVWRYEHPATFEEAKAEIRIVFLKRGLI